MDTNAARRARQKLFKADLTQAYTDEEATPPEWLDLTTHISKASAEVRELIERETRAFVDEPDIRRAIARRDRAAEQAKAAVEAINRSVARLNLIAPHQRFTRTPLDAVELIRPLFRSARSS